MFDAQRQGRLSFYMVNNVPAYYTLSMLSEFRSQQGKKVSQLDRLLLWLLKMSYSVNTERLESSNNADSHSPNS